jgi:large subunit ribosomal protein L13
MEYYIDAEGKILGKLAVEIANILRGKNKPNFVPYKDNGDSVIVKNIKKIKVSGKKNKNKIYYRHSGYLGSLKSESFEEVFNKNPEKVLKKAVFGMLPTNKLRKEQIKRLKIEK